MSKTTITPEFDPSTRTRTYRVTVAWGSGSSTVHGYATYADAQLAVDRCAIPCDAQPEPSGSSRLVAVAGAGRLTGR